MLSAQAQNERGGSVLVQDLGQSFVAATLSTCGPSLSSAICEKICGSLRCRIFLRNVETCEEIVVAVAGTEDGLFSSYRAHPRG